jgi:uncharacterized lipoprotein YddW (UPF0748 family)
VWLSLFDPFDLFAETARADRGPNPAGVREVFDLVVANGFNTVFVMVDSWYAYSIVHPEYEPRKSLAEWDAFAEVLKAAEERGIEVHLSFPLVNNRGYPTGAHQAPDFTPACGGSPAWRARYVAADGRITDSPSNICPSRPEARAWEAQLLRDLLHRYPSVSRVQLEEPGYDGRNFCVCDECRRQYAARHGGDLVAQIQREAKQERCSDSGCGPAADLKCEYLTSLIRQLREELPERAITWSATVSYDRWGDRRMGRDWVAWAGLGWLDFVAPMIYTRANKRFRGALEQGVVDELGGAARVCAGIGVHFGGALRPEPGRPAPDLNSAREVVRQIGTAREVARSTGHVNGVALFVGELLRPAYRTLGAAYLDAISSRAFQA